MWQNIAYILIGLGFLALIGWAVEGFFTSSDVPLAIRIAVGIIGAGILILIIVAVKDRLKKAKTENFKGVDR
jgi:Ca2+/Na+ antiporter